METSGAIQCTPHMVEEIMRANLAIDIRPLLPTITVPTLVVYAEGDPLCPVPNARYMAEEISGARCVVGPGDFHAPGTSDDARWIGRAILGDAEWKRLLDAHDTASREHRRGGVGQPYGQGPHDRVGPLVRRPGAARAQGRSRRLGTVQRRLVSR